MNGLIELLAFKAGGEIAEDRYGLFSLRLTEEEIQDFAKLIIRECVEVADKETMDDTVGYAILEHFGVEE